MKNERKKMKIENGNNNNIDDNNNNFDINDNRKDYNE